MEASAHTNALLRARLDELLGEYERARAGLGAARARMKSVQGHAQTTDGTVRVSVDAHGRLASLEIDPRAYRRYSPSQLAAEVLALSQSARAQATEALGEIMAPFLPAGVPFGAVADGEIDPADWAPRQPLTDQTFDAWRASLRGQPTDPQASA